MITGNITKQIKILVLYVITTKYSKPVPPLNTPPTFTTDMVENEIQGMPGNIPATWQNINNGTTLFKTTVSRVLSELRTAGVIESVGKNSQNANLYRIVILTVSSVTAKVVNSLADVIDMNVIARKKFKDGKIIDPTKVIFKKSSYNSAGISVRDDDMIEINLVAVILDALLQELANITNIDDSDDSFGADTDISDEKVQPLFNSDTVRLLDPNKEYWTF